MILKKDIISKNRYKKIDKLSKTRRLKDKTNIQKSIARKNKNTNLKSGRKKAINKKQTSEFTVNFLKIAICSLMLFGIAMLSKSILKLENHPILSVFSSNDKENKLTPNYEFKVGLTNSNKLDLLTSKNIIENELISKSIPSLISINEDYSINYILANSIKKINDLEYDIEIKSGKGISSSDVIKAIEDIKSKKTENIYFNDIKNIKKIEKIDDLNIKILLLESNPYFIYTLKFPIYNYESNKLESLLKLNEVQDDYSKFSVALKKSSIASINLKKYKDGDLMVENFKSNNLDMFITSSYNTMQLIGKYEYNLKKYRNGEAIFLLGNKDSQLFSKKEVRQALAYGINKDEIIKDVSMSFGEAIDLPYIYSTIKYKYDTHGAENSILSNGWKKNKNNVYSKYENGKTLNLSLKLLVNESDEIKQKIASKIKEMMEKLGVQIIIESISETDISNRVKNKDYDIVLSTIYVDETPNISYLYDYINVSENINNAINEINNSDDLNIVNNIKLLQNILSDEFACIGIMAKNTNIVYQKNIVGFENIKYMKIFTALENIGRLK